MKKTISPMLGIGIIIWVTYIIVQRFITPISDWVAIPLLVISIVLTLTGVFKATGKK